VSSGEILLPKLGLTMAEGLLSEWLVAEGDTVSVGQTIFLVETDKIANEVEAQVAGVLSRILVQAGETVPVGTPVAMMGGTSETPAIAAPADVGVSPSSDGEAEAPAATTDAVAPVRVTPNASGRRIATPLARRIAEQSGLTMDELIGTGPNGRVKAIDVRTSLAAREQVASASSVTPTSQSAFASATATPADPPALQTSSPEVPALGIRRTIAKRLSRSKQEIPHFYLGRDVEIDEVIALRRQLNAHGATPVSVNHFIVGALGRALAETPTLNAVWRDETPHQIASPDVGIAVETEHGLVVPVLRGAGYLGLDALSDAASGLVDRARRGSVPLAAMAGAAASVSNVGMLGVDSLVPIIDPDQAMILGVGRARRVLRPGPGDVAQAVTVVRLDLAVDHRLVDGAAGARFLALIATKLEAPFSLLRAYSPGA
jgi:pyruvate dehydrogenase E2 component (dihydrolipoamide acetyltransferase)